MIDGNPGCLKEYVIGVEVYDRKPSYHPSQNSIVRTEARRLRSKLKEYYGEDGREDPVYVYLRPGSYIPVFQCRKDLIGSRPAIHPEAVLLERPSSVTIAILPFKDVFENPVSSIFARGIPDELGYALMLTYGCNVVYQSLIACLNAQEHDLDGAMSKVGAQIAYEGSVRAEGTRLRVTARIVDATGLQLWVKRVDADTRSETSFAVEEQIASVLSAGFDALFGQSHRLGILPGS